MRSIEVIGYVMLFLGALLLIITFYFAYVFLFGNVGEIVSSDIVQVFGQALAPLVSACIRVMFLGIMGWIGSILTARGITLLREPLLKE